MKPPSKFPSASDYQRYKADYWEKRVMWVAIVVFAVWLVGVFWWGFTS